MYTGITFPNKSFFDIFKYHTVSPVLIGEASASFGSHTVCPTLLHNVLQLPATTQLAAKDLASSQTQELLSVHHGLSGIVTPIWTIILHRRYFRHTKSIGIKLHRWLHISTDRQPCRPVQARIYKVSGTHELCSLENTMWNKHPSLKTPHDIPMSSPD